MAEPISTTATGAVSVGFLALLIGAVGPVAADVMLVVISALAGCFIALSSAKNQSLIQSIGFVFIGVVVSLVLSWGTMNLIVSIIPQLNTPYTPSIIAMGIGFMSNQLPALFGALAAKFKAKIGV
jgi:predicted neutral ceramidase superfamily lipid hydrolase